MFTAPDLVRFIDAYKAAAGVPADSTASYRIFNDSNKLTALRAGGDLTTGRMLNAIVWLRLHWPEGVEMPEELHVEPQTKAAVQ